MGGPSIYYGMNALSHNIIMADKKKTEIRKRPVSRFHGERRRALPQSVSLSMCFLATKDRIIVVDPMGEYAPLIRRLGGQVIELAPDSTHYINPMDMKMNLTAH